MTYPPEFDEALDIPLCDGSILCECPECANAREEMIRWGHFVPTKEWEESRPTGEELEEKLKELY